MEMPRKNLKEMVEIKNTAIEMKNAFDGLTSRLNMANKRISKLEDRCYGGSGVDFSPSTWEIRV